MDEAYCASPDDLGLIPLLIFDQFDGYQLTHRGRFLREGRWLAAANPTWRAIRDELGCDAFHLLFVTRRDLFAGLEAVRFVQPEVLSLDWVEPAYIAALLDALVEPGTDAKPVVADPDAGWGALNARLMRDRVRPHNNVLSRNTQPQTDRFSAKTVPIVRWCGSVREG